MSQDSGVIPNETGAPVRAKINLAFAAVMSNNSGPTAPSPSYAYMWWPDTANDILKMRNAANTNWINGPKLSDLANFGTATLTAGAGSFSSSINGYLSTTIENTSTGTGAVTRLQLGNNTSSGAGQVVLYGGNHATLPNYLDLTNANGAPVRLMVGETAVVTSASTGVDVAGDLSATGQISSNTSLYVGQPVTGVSAQITVSSGNTGANNAFINLGTRTRDWQWRTGTSPYSLHLDYMGTDTPTNNILVLGKSGGTDLMGSLRVTSASPIIPASGTGLEIYYASGVFSGAPGAYLYSFDRTGGVFKPIVIGGSTINLQADGATVLGIAPGAAAVTGTIKSAGGAADSGNNGHGLWVNNTGWGSNGGLLKIVSNNGSQGLRFELNTAAAGDFSTSTLLGVLDGTAFTPGADNTQNFGSASLGWKELFCDNGTINTSDARKKTAVTSLSAAERAAASQLVKEIGWFKFLAAVAEKGEAAARRHIGMTVQRAIEIMEAAGLDPFAWGFICHDTWGNVYEDVQINVGAKVTKTRLVERQKTAARIESVTSIEMRDGAPMQVVKQVTVLDPVFHDLPVCDEAGRAVMIVDQPAAEAVVDEAGLEIEPARAATFKPLTHPVPSMEWVSETYEEAAAPIYETRLIREAGDKYSFRVHELLLFIAAATESRLSALEAVQ